MKPVNPSGFDASLNRSRSEACIRELLPRYDAMLSGSQSGEFALPLRRRPPTSLTCRSLYAHMGT
jgi:hypothetical protein